MPFTLPELPFDRHALGDFMSAETLDHHHGKHHRAYVDKLNAAVADQTPGKPFARRPDPRRRANGAIPRSATSPASTGTTISSGNAWRRPRGSGRRAAGGDDRRRIRLSRNPAGGS